MVDASQSELLDQYYNQGMFYALCQTNKLHT